MRILLVDPPGRNKGLNTGLGYLSAVLKDNHEVHVFDLNNIEIGFCGDPNLEMSVYDLEERIGTALEEYEPDVFGVSVKTFTAETAKHIFKFLKMQKSKVITIAGGPHITLDGFKFIQENGIDFGLEGEGEYTTVELCNRLEEKDGIEDIDGIFFWRNDQLVHNPRGNPINDLDDIPFPYYDNFSSIATNGGNLKEYPILTSRGCPFGCSYCSMPRIMGSKWRFHSTARVIQELEHAKGRYQSTSFTVVDDNFTLSLKRVEEICDQLVSEKVNLPWNSQNGIRADRISEALARKMKRAGCRYVWTGIESADQRVFESLNKGENLDDIKGGIKHFKSAGIGVGGFFIVGLPHSTRKADLKSVDFVKELGIDGWWFNFVPYPHTEAWNWVHDHARVIRQSNGVLQYGSNDIEPVFETEEYPKESRIKTYNEIHIRLKYFDRLVDPSLNQWNMWPKVFKKVLPYGITTVFSLMFFILKYNARLLTRIFRDIFNILL